MKKLLLSASLLLSFGVFSQTTIWSEDFDNNGGAGSNWSTLNESIGIQGDIANRWWISDTEAGNAIGACGSAGGGDQSLHVSSDALWAGDLGAAYEIGAGLCGSFPEFCPTTDKRSYSNSINTVGVSALTLSFGYMEGGEGLLDDATVIYSIDDGATWLTLDNPAKTLLTCAPQGVWMAYSFSLPASCENLTTLRIGFRWVNNDGGGTDPSFAVDDISITTPAGATETITTAAFVTTSWCFGDVITGNLDFTSTGTFNGPNVYTAQISDAAGSFAAPTAIGTLSSSASGALSIPVTIPGTMAVGNGYRVRVVASDPSTTGTDNGTDLEIFALPTVTLAAYSNVCVGDPAFNLSGGAPGGGIYSGPGVSGGMFTPSVAGVGNHTITYSYTNTNGCSSMATETITVDACSAATITTGAIAQMSWCYGTTVTDVLDFTSTGTFNAPNVYSAQMSDGTGSFAAPTIIGTLATAGTGPLTINIAIPGSMPAGTGYRIRVVASDPITIGTDNGSDIIIYDQPTVSLGAYTDVCIYTPIFTLTGGVPSGGTYSGPGIAAGSFDPLAAGLGTHTVTYNITDGNGCSNSAQQDIIVDACAGVEELDIANVQVYPNPASETFTIVSSSAIDKAVLTDMNGRIVKTFTDFTGELNIGEVQEGLYLVQIQLGKSIQTVRLVIE